MTAETDALTLQVQQRVRRERNARLLRGIGLTVLVTVVMVMLAISNRDQQAYKRSSQSMQELVALLENQPGVRIRLPNSKWVFNTRFRDLANERGKGGVCARPVDLFLWPDGWHVVVLDGETYEVLWMNADDFEAAAPDLGLVRE